MDRVIGANVHNLIREKRISGRALAAALGTSESGLSRRLRGERRWMAKHVADAARILEVSPVDLYGADTTDVGTPFCPAHPDGAASPCRDCGRARLSAALIRNNDERGMARELDVSDAPVVEVDAEHGDADVVRPGALRLDVFDPEGVRVVRVEVEAGSVEVQLNGHAREPIGGAS